MLENFIFYCFKIKIIIISVDMSTFIITVYYFYIRFVVSLILSVITLPYYIEFIIFKLVELDILIKYLGFYIKLASRSKIICAFIGFHYWLVLFMFFNRI
uniref:Uncharacterized protein n=1 Tax=Heterorhabditis bacteriophora TaxID=37862 RepID=A0A1I7WDI6_HETBA